MPGGREREIEREREREREQRTRGGVPLVASWVHVPVALLKAQLSFAACRALLASSIYLCSHTGREWRDVISRLVDTPTP